MHAINAFLYFSAHWDVLANCFDFQLHFKNCNAEQCTCLGACMKTWLCSKQSISLCMIVQYNVDYLSGNGCISNSLEKKTGQCMQFENNYMMILMHALSLLPTQIMNHFCHLHFIITSNQVTRRKLIELYWLIP